MKQYKGIAMLKAETPEQKTARLERELQQEKHGRKNDMLFSEEEYKKLSIAYLELCDNGYCKGDFSVGDRPCQYWDDMQCICILKRFTGQE